jgi:hypothetical protein
MKSAITRAVLILGLSAFVHPQAAAADPPGSTQWIVTTAKATGYTGETYESALRILNLGLHDAPLRLTFFPQTPLGPDSSAFGDPSAASTVDVVIPAGQKVSYWNALGLFSRAAGAGAIRIVSTGTDPQGKPIPVSATSMTMTYPAGTVFPGPAVTGPLIAAQGPDALVGLGEPAAIPFLWLGGDDTFGSYRSNIFLASTNADSDTVVRLTLVTNANVSQKSREITLGPLTQTQINNVYGYFEYVPFCPPCPSDPMGADEVRIEVSVLSGGPVAMGASVIDLLNSSSFYVPAVKRPAP